MSIYSYSKNLQSFVDPIDFLNIYSVLFLWMDSIQWQKEDVSLVVN